MENLKFYVGQKVSMIDENIDGVVTAVDGYAISLETTDGFVMEVRENELVGISKLDLSGISQEVIDAFKKADLKPNKNIRKPKKKEKSIPPMEVDLHIHHLVKNQKGLSNHEMLNIQLDTARRQLEFAINKRIQKVVFIHGVGEGVLRTELEYLFSRYEQVKFYDADYQKYGLGATEVYIFQNTP